MFFAGASFADTRRLLVKKRPGVFCPARSHRVSSINASSADAHGISRDRDGMVMIRVQASSTGTLVLLCHRAQEKSRNPGNPAVRYRLHWTELECHQLRPAPAAEMRKIVRLGFFMPIPSACDGGHDMTTRFVSDGRAEGGEKGPPGSQKGDWAAVSMCAGDGIASRYDTRVGRQCSCVKKKTDSHTEQQKAKLEEEGSINGSTANGEQMQPLKPDSSTVKLCVRAWMGNAI
jgi:hypothetical protein